jgi:hypothetical protein
VCVCVCVCVCVHIFWPEGAQDAKEAVTGAKRLASHLCERQSLKEALTQSLKEVLTQKCTDRSEATEP